MTILHFCFVVLLGFFTGVLQGNVTAECLRSSGYASDRIVRASAIYILLSLWLVTADIAINGKVSNFGFISMIGLFGSALGQMCNAFVRSSSNNGNILQTNEMLHPPHKIFNKIK